MISTPILIYRSLTGDCRSIGVINDVCIRRSSRQTDEPQITNSPYSVFISGAAIASARRNEEERIKAAVEYASTSIPRYGRANNKTRASFGRRFSSVLPRLLWSPLHRNLLHFGSCRWRLMLLGRNRQSCIFGQQREYRGEWRRYQRWRKADGDADLTVLSWRCFTLNKTESRLQ
ncbi:hypothetical protein BDV18DRAFT_144743 [Aspergillus unguis]